MDNTAMAVISSIMLAFGFVNGYIMAKIFETSHVLELKAQLYEIEDENQSLTNMVSELETEIKEFEKTKEFVKEVLDGHVCLPPPPIAKRTETYVADDGDEDQTPPVTSP